MLNCSGRITILNGGYIAIMQKSRLIEMRDNNTIASKVRVDGNKLCLGKNGGYIPSSLGGRSISVGRQGGRQAGRRAVRRKFLQFDSFNSANSKA